MTAPVVVGTTSLCLVSSENTPTCLSSMSYRKLWPSGNQTGSDVLDGSAIGTSATASRPSGSVETKA